MKRYEPPEEESRKLALRWFNLGRRIPGQVLRLDLYRLVCYFQTSEYLATLSDGGDFCPWQGLRDEFQDSEIMRILLQMAVAIRFIGFGQADQMKSQRDVLEESVGLLFKSVTDSAPEPLQLREACNKIIHAHNIVLDSKGSGNPYTHFVKPKIFCYHDFNQKEGWKAEIDLLPFVEVCDSLAQLF